MTDEAAATLVRMRCVACRKGEPTITREELAEVRDQIRAWDLIEVAGVERLRRTFTFPDFATALAFTAAVGALAEEEGHHPQLVTEWGRTTVSWWTHKIDGLHRNDLIMAARTDQLYPA